LFISTSKNKSFGYGAPASEDGGSGLSFFNYNEMGVFHGGFASSSQPFASAPHDGVLRVLLFFLSRYHTFGVWACSFLITEAATFPIVTINSRTVHGSTSFIKEKEYRHIERLFDGTGRGGGCLFCDLWCSRSSLGGATTWATIWCRGWVGKDIVRFLLLGNLSELVFPDRFGGGGRLWSWLIFSLFSPVYFRCIMG
jgi:hypothetical protein